jgi:quercetin dioxygenase-like cupin family protein
VQVHRRGDDALAGRALALGARLELVVQLGAMGVRFLEANGSVSLVEHPLAPRGLAGPLHRHANEDEYSFVLEGRIGAQLGDDVVHGEAGDLIVKPRGQWHTFWNAGDEPARVLEVIAPGGFEGYFERLGELLAAGGPPDPAAIGAIAADYDLELDPASIPRLCAEHGLAFG